MRKAIFTSLILLFVLLITTAIVSYFSVIKYVYPHTYLDKSNVGWLRDNQIDRLLDTAYGKKFWVKVKDRIYPFSYRQLGILIDKKTTVRTLFENNARPFPDNILRFFDSLGSQRMVLPSLVFTQDYTTYINNAVFDFTTRKDQYQVNDVDKTVVFTDNEEKYRIDGDHLKELLTFNFGEGIATYEPKLIPVADPAKLQSVEKQNQAIQTVYASPLSVVIQDAGLTSVAFSSDDLKKMFSIKWGTAGVEFIPQEVAIMYLIDAKIDPVVPRNRGIDKAKIRQDITASFLARSRGADSGPVLVTTSQKMPTTTHGEIASRYIEIDINQQKMYLFDGGQMTKSYTVSTGLYYPTPTGQFHIMNKAAEGYSDIFNVYMPWWMAFYYGWAGGQDAYFGIHELPYWYAGYEKKQRPREFLGSPHTGGCVSLDIGAAKEVYDFSYVGMDVVIFP